MQNRSWQADFLVGLISSFILNGCHVSGSRRGGRARDVSGDTFADFGFCTVMNRPSRRQRRIGCRPKLLDSDAEKVGAGLDFA